MTKQITNGVVDNPIYYSQGEIQPYDFIKAQKMDFTEGSIIKYLTRYKFKGKPLEDLKKARWYLDKLIEKEGKNEMEKN